MLDLEIIRVGCEAATEGPWTWLEGHIGRSLLSAPNDSVLHITGPGAVDPTRINICADDDNAAFIAHAREDIPALIAEVERLRDVLQTIFLHSDPCSSENTMLTEIHTLARATLMDNR